MFSTRHRGSSDRNSTGHGFGRTQISKAAMRRLGFDVQRRIYNAREIKVLQKQFGSQLSDGCGKVGINFDTPPTMTLKMPRERATRISHVYFTISQEQRSHVALHVVSDTVKSEMVIEPDGFEVGAAQHKRGLGVAFDSGCTVYQIVSFIP